MSEYIEILNRIKKNYSHEWLTPSQLEVYKNIISFIEPPNSIINVYGSRGVGKTFLGWVMSLDGMGQYFTSFDELTPTDKCTTAILDNCLNERLFIRNLRNVLKNFHYNYFIVLTVKQADDKIPSFELKLTSNDIKIFKNNLGRVDIRTKDAVYSSFWDYINNAEV